MAQIIEGTWEEIKQHAAELEGHVLRVIIDPDLEDLAAEIPAPPFAVHDREKVADLLCEAIDRIDQGRGIEATPEYWASKAQLVHGRLGPE